MISAYELKYFSEVAKCLHFSKAAQRLGITQPALSHGIARLENELGVNLFWRSKKGTELTPAGRRLLQYANGMLKQWQDLKSAVQNEVSDPAGSIRLGVHTAVAQYTLPQIMLSLSKNYPKISIDLHHGLSRHITAEVISGNLDIGIVVNPVRNLNLVIREICQDMVTVVKSMRCFNNDLLIYDPSLLQSQEIISRLAKKKIDFPRSLESSSLEVISKLVVSGVGLGILPMRVAELQAEVKLIRLEGAPYVRDKICLVCRPELARIARGKVIIEIIRNLQFHSI